MALGPRAAARPRHVQAAGKWVADGRCVGAGLSRLLWFAKPLILLAPLLQELIQRHTDELARSITQEQGKTLADARGDVFRGLGALARWQLLPCLPAVLACPLLLG